MKTLETERLLLRLWSMQDADDLYEYAKNPNVGPNAGWEPHKDKEFSRNIIKMFIEDEVWAIEYKENNKVIGSIGLHEDRKRIRINGKMLGYVLSEDYWGKGLMTEAASAVIKHGFEEMNLNIISVYHYPFNDKSKRVIEKCGFKYEGTLREATRIFDGRILDDLCYSILKEEYEADKKLG
ncbi:GNAT family N-acetyltransferase [Clostridium polynesiense]|uniref:GNAT family N-acetyltransferase n=1 Tax=Clostridium polynesiense TaxID=1325933 RepID=UPI00058D9EE2|nr:GNAT family protein [Clostridium polynesiense]